jgi:hypothetical protein
MQTMKSLIDRIIQEKARGNGFQEMNYKMKLMLKGIPVNSIDEHTPNDEALIEKIHQAAKEFNVQLPNLISHAL